MALAGEVWKKAFVRCLLRMVSGAQIQWENYVIKAHALAAMGGKLKAWARAIERDVHAVYLAARDPRTPWYAKALAICVAGYALSPIDLIPDFIPVLGCVDDLVIVPLGILAVM